MSAGHASARCAGTAPRVCIAEAGGAEDRLEHIRGEIVRSLTTLRQAGVQVTVPATVSDNLLTGRHKEPSTRSAWWLPLSQQAGRNGPGMVGVRYGVLLTAVRFPCAFPSTVQPGQSVDWIVNHDAAMLWAATLIDTVEPYLGWRRGEYGGSFQNPREVLAKVQERAGNAARLAPKQQSVWFQEEQQKACRLVREATA
ncbi:hypothetical protein SAM23877_6464 [Streptomyces ambofaciens ATCC 23877]|uniref:Uncharacterized protein n=1 Tax=Streptomyces ambofaciens (strain ATCC 23877 / 3486 / DSM 40053 / JCM 4204 / NBRC 12836 / NRRL B-2516) TaxID=278992 RepID=A0A0K2B2M0_STRA7|nr:hypothetical protein [Streptomyces ambofaciens]AKZ59509.1 hypothetical protein SAM23877_6464 [Streptomyces ambofaciens ATCC 23877]